MLESDSSKTAAPNENWQDSLNELERELAAYRKVASSGATEEELASAAARVASAVQLAQAGSPVDRTKDLPPIYQPAHQAANTLPAEVQSQSQPEATSTMRPKNLKKLRRSTNAGPQSNEEGMVGGSFDRSSDTSSIKGENPGKQIGRGALMVVATPFAVAGMGLYAAGMIAEGVGMVLKGMGSVGKQPLKNIRGTLKGKKRSQK